MLGAVRSAASWYMRRRGIVRFLIFLLLFVAPIFWYSLQHVPTPAELNRTAAEIASPPPAPECRPLEEVRGRQVYYIGGFAYTRAWGVNGTACIYEYTGGYGLLLAAGYEPEPLFIVTIDAVGTVNAGDTTYNYTRVTVILPATPPPEIPLKEHVCELVGGAPDPYTAYTRRELPASYAPACRP